MSIPYAVRCGYRGGLPVPRPKPELFADYDTFCAALVEWQEPHPEVRRLRRMLDNGQDDALTIRRRQTAGESFAAAMRDQQRLELLRLEADARTRNDPSYRGR